MTAEAVVDQGARRSESGVSVSLHGLDGPTAERAAQGPILAPVAAGEGRAGNRRGARAVDPLGWLYDRGHIDRPSLQAGLEFRRAFAAARLEPQRAAPLQPRVDGGATGGRLVETVEDAKAVVHRDMKALGGFRSPAASIVWSVVGEGDSVTAWRRMARHGGGFAPRHDSARRILVDALQTLALRRGLTGGKR